MKKINLMKLALLPAKRSLGIYEVNRIDNQRFI